MPVIAVIFDFDDTLMPDSTSALLESRGIDSQEFWTETTKALLEDGYSPAHAYLNALLREVRPGGRLEGLSNRDLREFGATLDDRWFRGLPEVFDDLLASVESVRDTTVEFYVISGGLQQIVEGSSHVDKYFEAAYGCQLGDDPDSGSLAEIPRCVTFTEKTRFIFEIHKGVTRDDTKKDPYAVNAEVPRERRRIPMENMIYVGDGLTDVPCFSLLKANEGTSFGVWNRERKSAKQAFQELVQTERVSSLYSPNYTEDGDLGAMIRAAVSTAISKDAISAVRPT